MKKLCLLSLLCMFAGGAFASIYFSPTTGNWNVDANWDKGYVPLDNADEIKIGGEGQICTVDQTQIDYNDTKISIFGGPTSGSTLEILTGGYLGAGREIRVGSAGSGGGGALGAVVQTGGTLDVLDGGKIMIGYKAGGTGTYTISGGKLTGTDGRLYIGANGAAGAVGTLIIQGTDPNKVEFNGRIYIASDSSAGDSNLGTGTLRYDLSGGAVTRMIAHDNISIDAGGGGTANLIVNADIEPVADIVLVQNTTAFPVYGAFDTLNAGSGAEGTVVVIGGAVMRLTYQYNADGDDQNNDIALVLEAASTDLAHNPTPNNGDYVASELSQLSWTNPDPNDGVSDITCTVYLGTEPNRLDTVNMDQVIIGIANPTSIAINESNFPISYDEVNGGLYENTQYYWFVDCDDPSKIPSLISGLPWTFTVGQEPVVDAGEDQAVWLDPNEVTVYLEATVTDDQTPVLLWTQVENGAPDVTIVTPDIEDPTITFTERGDYEFTLTADDGITSPVSDTVRIVVGDDACDASHIEDPENAYNDADQNQDCIVNLDDFIALFFPEDGNGWLNCTDTVTNCGF